MNVPLDDPKSELDYHTNIIGIGKHCFVFEWPSKYCTVNPFNDLLRSAKDVPIINSSISFDFLYSHECYILLCCNALYLPNMLTPSINHAWKWGHNKWHSEDLIYLSNLTGQLHNIFQQWAEDPLHINGTFSLFHTRRNNDDELQTCDNIFITPDY